MRLFAQDTKVEALKEASLFEGLSRILHALAKRVLVLSEDPTLAS